MLNIREPHMIYFLHQYIERNFLEIKFCNSVRILVGTDEYEIRGTGRNTKYLEGKVYTM